MLTFLALLLLLLLLLIVLLFLDLITPLLLGCLLCLLWSLLKFGTLLLLLLWSLLWLLLSLLLWPLLFWTLLLWSTLRLLLLLLFLKLLLSGLPNFHGQISRRFKICPFGGWHFGSATLSSKISSLEKCNDSTKRWRDEILLVFAMWQPWCFLPRCCSWKPGCFSADCCLCIREVAHLHPSQRLVPRSPIVPRQRAGFPRDRSQDQSSREPSGRSRRSSRIGRTCLLRVQRNPEVQGCQIEFGRSSSSISLSNHRHHHCTLGLRENGGNDDDDP